MLVRIGAALIGLFYGANGLRMLMSPQAWFAQVSRADPIGPYNHHLVIDVGLAFLAAGLAFLAFAWRPEWRLLALGASGFIIFHGLFHLFLFIEHGGAHPAVAAAVVLPALLGVALCWPIRKAA